MMKKLFVIEVSSILLVAMAVAIGVTRVNGWTNRKPNDQDKSISNKAVQNICQPADTPEECVKGLTLGSMTDPKEPIKRALMAAKGQIIQALNHSAMAEKTFRKEPRTFRAFETCDEALDLALDNIQETFDTISTLDSSEIGERVNDLQTWLSSSFSYSTMCLDAFEDNSTSTVEAKKEMEKIIQSSRDFTNKALVMFNQYDNKTLRPSLSGHHLLAYANGFPTWLDEGRRKLLAHSANETKPDAIVAKDGSGQFESLRKALSQVPKRKGNETYVIYVKAGLYEEHIEISKKMSNIMIIGDGPTKTVITGSKNFVDGFGTFKTGTVRALGAGFIAKDIGFENTAGPEKHQAVALHVGGDMSVIHNCRIDGYQDTLLAAANRQFYKGCTILGTVDFIFGYSSSIFQNCEILIKKPMRNQKCIVTADGRDNAHLKSGIVIQNSVITAAPDMVSAKKDFNSYLGRPWKRLSQTVIMNTVIDDLIHPDGWMPWGDNSHIDTCFYGEFNNTGPGANTTSRVSWAKSLNAKQAEYFTVSRFINGEMWIPKAGVSFDSGL